MQDPAQQNLAFFDPDLPIDERVDDLVSRLTLIEKASQLLHDAPRIERLGIPAYSWWNECLHGVARAGIATVFPQAIGMAATWNVQRVREVATVISDEARAKHHEYLRHGDHGTYKGLTFWSPNVNIFRDPRWGRGHETYGECPYLTGQLGIAFCRGLQGDDPKYLKAIATPKHFAVHSGPEGLRHRFDAKVSPKDLRETYLPAFFDCIVHGGAYSVMGAYNRTNGEPCCGSQRLLVDILRKEWGFVGYVVSDCWAVKDFHESHHVTADFEESAALAIRKGCDLNCGCSFEHIPQAVERGLLDESDIDRALRRLLSARMKLGMFDPPERVGYAAIPFEINDCEAHRHLSRVVAQESMVLLKNDGLLPLSPDLGSVAVIGPNAHEPRVLLGNYCGTPSRSVTPLDAIRAAASPKTRIGYAEGCRLTGTRLDGPGPAGNLSEALAVAVRADVVVVCLGLSADIEGEEGDASSSAATGDRIDLSLPGLQQRLLSEIVSLKKPTVLVLLSGSALGIEWAATNVNAIVQAWYPGQEGGTAIADVLFGRYNPAGRLPVTFPRSEEDLPPFDDYAMIGRTYRYLDREPLFPFGFGLSYTRFEYSDLELSNDVIVVGSEIEISATVTNVGSLPGDEVVELYVQDLEASCRVPHRELRGFSRITLEPGEQRRVGFRLTARDLSLIDERGIRLLESGRYRVSLGSSQPDARSAELLGRSPLSTEFEMVGERRVLPY